MEAGSALSLKYDNEEVITASCRIKEWNNLGKWNLVLGTNLLPV